MPIDRSSIDDVWRGQPSVHSMSRPTPPDLRTYTPQPPPRRKLRPPSAPPPGETFESYGVIPTFIPRSNILAPKQESQTDIQNESQLEHALSEVTREGVAFPLIAFDFEEGLLHRDDPRTDDDEPTQVPQHENAWLHQRWEEEDRQEEDRHSTALTEVPEIYPASHEQATTILSDQIYESLMAEGSLFCTDDFTTDKVEKKDEDEKKPLEGIREAQPTLLNDEAEGSPDVEEIRLTVEGNPDQGQPVQLTEESLEQGAALLGASTNCRRKRSRREKNRASKKSDQRTKESGRSRRGTSQTTEAQCQEVIREMPTRADFRVEYAHLDHKRFRWVLKPPEPPRDESRPRLKASKPWIPGMEDIPLPPRLPPGVNPPTPSVSAASSVSLVSSGKRTISEVDLHEESESGYERPYVRAPPNLMNLPLEIRQMIYGYLFVSPTAIHVYDGWAKVYKVYKHYKYILHTAILSTSYRAYVEGTEVLYGENTFCYRLRDAAQHGLLAPPVADVNMLAHDEDDLPDDPDINDDEGSEYEEGNENRRAAPARRSQRSRKKKEPKKDGGINIARFNHLFRSIAIEAERNRAATETMNAMAKAIKVFIDPPQLDEESRTFLRRFDHKASLEQRATKRAKTTKNNSILKRMSTIPVASPDMVQDSGPNIRHLIIRINPVLLDNGNFSFVDFFAPSSPVTVALKQLEMQVLHIQIPGASLAPARERNALGPRLKVDLRHRRLTQRIKSGRHIDTWAHVPLMIQSRREEAQKACNILDHLGTRVKESCRKWTEDGLLGEDDDDWLYEDEEDDLWGG